jgi:hypothetical protein
MDLMDIIAEYNARSRSARNYREVALLLLVVAAIVLALHAINRARIEFWGGIILAAGIILLVVSFALAMLSFLKLRCPNCSRVLGEVHDAAFCPACGVPLKDDGSIGMVPAAGAKPRKTAAAEQALARRANLSKWEPRNNQIELAEYPEEGYPKNIRMFTTKDETELTKRYIHLINKDDRNRETQAEDLFAHQSGRVKVDDSRKPIVKRETEKPEGRPNWRREDTDSSEEETPDFFSRLINKIRP